MKLFSTCKMQGINMSKLSKVLWLLVFLMMKIKEVHPQEIITEDIYTFCYNSSLEGHRLNATLLEVHNVSSRIACIDHCLLEPCCRSMNYKHGTSPNEMSICELLHNLEEDNLEINPSYDHVFIINPIREYNLSCLTEEVEDKGSGDNSTQMIYHPSCRDILLFNSFATDGVYNLQLNETSEIYPVYCHMSNLSSQCGGGGWTLVMKVDGNMETFNFDSRLWTNNETFNIEGGLEGLTENEIKLASYHNTPFTKICLGMTVNNATNMILLNHSANSLYNVIADGIYRRTYLGRDVWLTLVNNGTIQEYCNKEGFNVEVVSTKLFLRIGLAGNEQDNCVSPDSSIGFGMQYDGPGQRRSSGIIYASSHVSSFGYIFVQ